VRGTWYQVPGTVVDATVFLLLPGTSRLPLLKRNRCMPHDSGLMVRQKHVTGTPGTYGCIVLRHDINLHRHYTCKNATYMWRYYDLLNPQCGATYDAEGNVELFLKTMDFTGPTCLFCLVKKPKIHSALSL
jgi:hypothetical protein